MTVSTPQVAGAKVQGKKVTETVSSKPDDVLDYVEKPQGTWYGVKSYLHQFYEQRSRNSSFDDPESWSLLAANPKNRSKIFCQAAFVLGVFFLLLGSCGILVGYVWPHHNDSVQRIDERFILVDKDSLAENQTLKTLKIIGLIVFAFGGFVIAASLLIPSCCRICGELEAQKVERKETAKALYPQISEDVPTVPVSPIEKKIPVMEEVQAVQPKNEKVRMTSSNDLMLLENSN